MTVSRRQFLVLAGAGITSLPYLPTARGQAVPGRCINPGPRPPLLHAPRIVIVGIGGAGGNIVSRTLYGRLRDVECVAIDRDEQVLNELPADVTLSIGPRARRGLDYGRLREHGRMAMEERRDDVARILSNADLVLLVGGMGGGTGTGGAPVLARLAGEAGALTMAVVTRPFGFEGRWRNRQAAAGILDLTRVCDATVVVPHDGIIDIAGRNAPYRCALEQIDDAVGAGVRAVAGAVTVPGMICVGIEDILAIFRSRGVGALGIGTAAGPDRARVAARRALACPLLRDAAPGRVGGSLLRIAAADLTLAEIQRASEIVSDTLADETLMVGYDAAEPSLGDALCVTLVVAGSVEAAALG
ncbi:MAG: hypothetical protein A3I61_03735 [Acidobacteria bacterium RIFCSPLOWO2_02_FULL_68_18]|nr:MAG: hypothetical protein A3I61_03735 [Acidobacteria bacterium RIFCSPLOWO2_02_FULL_68_18]OFW51358.1 MAG: hypothetical protein A3G77_11560 [Acidobacteria bacterium RIFCSPLOWO2_12_FULL_68_19]